MCDFDVLFDDVELRTLLMYHMRNIAEQLVQFANRLLNVADLRLALDDEGLLEIDLVLVRQS